MFFLFCAFLPTISALAVYIGFVVIAMIVICCWTYRHRGWFWIAFGCSSGAALLIHILIIRLASQLREDALMLTVGAIAIIEFLVLIKIMEFLEKRFEWLSDQ